jgi:hypothetical protein
LRCVYSNVLSLESLKYLAPHPFPYQFYRPYPTNKYKHYLWKYIINYSLRFARFKRMRLLTFSRSFLLISSQQNLSWVAFKRIQTYLSNVRTWHYRSASSTVSCRRILVWDTP